MSAEKGKCMACGTQIGYNSIGYCHKCASDYWAKHDEEYPFIVRFGDDQQEFKTEQEAEDFVRELRRVFVERK